MSSFLPYIEDDGYVYIYDYENGVQYYAGEIIYDNNIFYRAEKDFVASGTNAETDFNGGKLGQFNKLDMTGGVSTIGPVDAKNGYGFGNNDVSLICPSDSFVVGYRIYGNGAANYPDGGRTGSSLRHWMYTRHIKKD